MVHILLEELEEAILALLNNVIDLRNICGTTNIYTH